MVEKCCCSWSIDLIGCLETKGWKKACFTFSIKCHQYKVADLSLYSKINKHKSDAFRESADVQEKT